MEELIGLGVVLGIFVVAGLIGWGTSALYDVYWKYRVKKNRIKYPEFFELIKKRDAISNEQSGWWHLRDTEKKWIDDYHTNLRYTGIIKNTELEAHQTAYNIAEKKLREFSIKLDEAREAVENYREEHNIRHW